MHSLMSYVVRQLGRSDYLRILALWETAGLHFKPKGRDTREAFEAQLASGVQTVLGVEDAAGELVGTVIATHDSRRGWINRVAVHPAHRRQGIARRLIAAAEDVLHEQGIHIIAALIEPDNGASLALFEAAEYIEWPGLHYMSKRDSDDV